MDSVSQQVVCWVVSHSFAVADGIEASGAAICTFGREFYSSTGIHIQLWKREVMALHYLQIASQFFLDLRIITLPVWCVLIWAHICGRWGNTATKTSAVCVFPSSCFHLSFVHEEHKTMESISRHGGDYSLWGAGTAGNNSKYIDRQQLF